MGGWAGYVGWSGWALRWETYPFTIYSQHQNWGASYGGILDHSPPRRCADQTDRFVNIDVLALNVGVSVGTICFMMGFTCIIHCALQVVSHCC